MSIYKLRGSVASGDTEQNSLASTDVQMDGTITSVTFVANMGGMDALGDFCQSELSFMSTHTFNATDTRGSIAMFFQVQGFLTSGGAIPSNFAISNLSIPVSAGERIHFHASTSTGPNGVVHVHMHVDDGIPLGIKPRRR